MAFNSFAFWTFLTILFSIYWIIPNRFRWCMLLIASYYFYFSWSKGYCLLLLFITAITYFSAIQMEKSTQKQRKIILSASALLVFSILFVFKYINFFEANIFRFLSLFIIQLNETTIKLIMPIGISFYTFQTIGYLSDVYLGGGIAERNFGKYALFVAFFPQLLAGPINRGTDLLPQLSGNKQFDCDIATYGLKQIVWGFFKKMFIADTLAMMTDRVYGELSLYKGFSLVLVAFLYTIQIYCDFSGYSDIAIGTAKLFGISMKNNFQSPYFACTIKEFWRRWHISLSTWFRDYVYIPLGGNRGSFIKQSCNLMITFLLSGLWHGASWTFVIWGGIHGLAQIFEHILTKKSTVKSKSKKIVSWFIVFVFLNITWIFFRASTLQEVKYILVSMFYGINNPVKYLIQGYQALEIGSVNFLLLSGSIILLTIFDYLSIVKVDVFLRVKKMPPYLKGGIYVIFLFFLMLFLPVEQSKAFIYFEF